MNSHLEPVDQKLVDEIEKEKRRSARGYQTTFEHKYLALLEMILNEGEYRSDRTGTGTIAVFAPPALDIDLTQGFPAVTTKKLAWRAMLSELLWFIEGSGNNNRLANILHGDVRHADGTSATKPTIWTANAEAPSWKEKAEYEGDLGRVYGVQWRSWRTFKPVDIKVDDVQMDIGLFQEGEPVDQLSDVIHKLKYKHTDRRIILSSWNVGEINQMALPPCHMFAQFYLSNDNKLSCQMYQRSVDTFLGLPFNIASYALLTQMIAHVIEATPHRLKLVMGDTHIYKDHVAQVEEQIRRVPHHLPKVMLNKEITNIEDFGMNDVILSDYKHDEAITAKMSA